MAVMKVLLRAAVQDLFHISEVLLILVVWAKPFVSFCVGLVSGTLIGEKVEELSGLGV